jgi:thymidylate synthase ThyX
MTMPAIAPYVSSLTDSVYVLHGLPPEVIAVLFAYYSRSPKGLRENLESLLQDQELGIVEGGARPSFTLANDKARAFHEKWVVGYGHASVAEHAVVHMALEGVSILATKVIEDARLGSFTEKSTRYVVFRHGSAVMPSEWRDKTWAMNLCAETCDALFDAYQACVTAATEGLKERHPVAGFPSAAAWETACKTRALDLCRGLLPASTGTNVGLTMNTRELGHLLKKMAAHPLGEVRALGQKMHAAAAGTVAPTLLRGPVAELDPERRQSMGELRGGFLLASCPPAIPTGVRVLRHDHDALERVADALRYELAMDLPNNQLHSDQIANVRRALRDRAERAGAPRAFEAASLQVELELDYGAYRDLQRHRMLAPFTGLLSPLRGWDLPAALVDLGCGDVYELAMVRAAEAWRVLAEVDAFAAQAVVPLGFNHRVLWSLNLRELIHVVELRSGRQGHPRYRRIAWALDEAASTLYPWLRGVLRVDRQDYDLSRV